MDSGAGQWYEFQHMDSDGYVNINYRRDNFHSKYCIFQPKAISINFLAIRFGKFKAKNKGKVKKVVGRKSSLANKGKVEQIQKLFSRMDPNGNGYVEQPEFEKYLEMYGIKIDKERCGYLFSLIQSHNAELEDGGSSHNGKFCFLILVIYLF